MSIFCAINRCLNPPQPHRKIWHFLESFLFWAWRFMFQCSSTLPYLSSLLVYIYFWRCGIDYTYMYKSYENGSNEIGRHSSRLVALCYCNPSYQTWEISHGYYVRSTHWSVPFNHSVARLHITPEHYKQATNSLIVLSWAKNPKWNVHNRV